MAVRNSVAECQENNEITKVVIDGFAEYFGPKLLCHNLSHCSWRYGIFIVGRRPRIASCICISGDCKKYLCSQSLLNPNNLLVTLGKNCEFCQHITKNANFMKWLWKQRSFSSTDSRKNANFSKESKNNLQVSSNDREKTQILSKHRYKMQISSKHHEKLIIL